MIDNNEKWTCPVCWLDSLSDLTELECRHVFHRTCLLQSIERRKHCPKCRRVLSDYDYASRVGIRQRTIWGVRAVKTFLLNPESREFRAVLAGCLAFKIAALLISPGKSLFNLPLLNKPVFDFLAKELFIVTCGFLLGAAARGAQCSMVEGVSVAIFSVVLLEMLLIPDIQYTIPGVLVLTVGVPIFFFSSFWIGLLGDE